MSWRGGGELLFWHLKGQECDFKSSVSYCLWGLDHAPFPLSLFSSQKLLRLGVGRMANPLRALTALSGDLSSIPRTHMATHNLCNSNSRVSDALFLPHGQPTSASGAQTCMQTQTKNKNLKKY